MALGGLEVAFCAPAETVIVLDGQIDGLLAVLQLDEAHAVFVKEIGDFHALIFVVDPHRSVLPVGHIDSVLKVFQKLLLCQGALPAKDVDGYTAALFAVYLARVLVGQLEWPS